MTKYQGPPSSTGMMADLDIRIESRLSDLTPDRGDGAVAAMLGAAIQTADNHIADAGVTVPSAEDCGTGLICRNVRVMGRRTSIKLEEEFWGALEHLAERCSCTVNDLCDRAERLKGGGTLTSAIRVFVLRNLAAGQ